MNKKIEQKINLFKLWLTFFVAIDSGITAWLVNNFDKLNDWLKILSELSIIFVTLMIILINKSIFRKIERLE